MDQQLQATVTRTVTDADTAVRMGSGSLKVLATPALAAQMENAACRAAESLLEEGQTSVGTSLELQHTSATPVGMRVTCCAILVEKNGRELTFQITAEDEKGMIGTALHKRFIVASEKFLAKTYGKIG